MCGLTLRSLQGRIVEIFGPEASGKTTLALHVIAEAQKEGGFLHAEPKDFFIPSNHISFAYNIYY